MSIVIREKSRGCVSHARHFAVINIVKHCHLCHCFDVIIWYFDVIIQGKMWVLCVSCPTLCGQHFHLCHYHCHCHYWCHSWYHFWCHGPQWEMRGVRVSCKTLCSQHWNLPQVINHFASLTLHHVKLSFLFDCQQSSNSINQINHCFSLSIHLKPNLHNMSIFSECESVLSFFTARLDTQWLYFIQSCILISKFRVLCRHLDPVKMQNNPNLIFVFAKRWLAEPSSLLHILMNMERQTRWFFCYPYWICCICI